MEIIAKNIRVFKNCIGTAKTNRDIMIAIGTESESEIHDLFLTKEQSLDLIEQLIKRLKEEEN